MSRVPHPLPYQGSKRLQATTIATYIREGGTCKTLYEPFAGSAAVTLYAAAHGLAERFVIGDACAPIVGIWSEIINHPERIARAYSSLWCGQAPGDTDYYNQVRERYNQTKDDPHLLLYLIVRCVKNAIRFNAQGRFTQSADKRRLGMHPDKMAIAIHESSRLLQGRCEFFAGDFAQCVSEASSRDFVYMDPPYQGTSYGKDKRYFEQLTTERLVHVLENLNQGKIPWLLSYDGSTGEKTYGEPLPAHLSAKRVLIHIGRSTQSTLNGRSEETIESLYLSPTFASDDTQRESFLSLRVPQDPLTLQRSRNCSYGSIRVAWL